MYSRVWPVHSHRRFAYGLALSILQACFNQPESAPLTEASEPFEQCAQAEEPIAEPIRLTPTSRQSEVTSPFQGSSEEIARQIAIANRARARGDKAKAQEAMAQAQKLFDKTQFQARRERPSSQCSG